jgi:hypothetical protein
METSLRTAASRQRMRPTAIILTKISPLVSHSNRKQCVRRLMFVILLWRQTALASQTTYKADTRISWSTSVWWFSVMSLRRQNTIPWDHSTSAVRRFLIRLTTEVMPLSFFRLFQPMVERHWTKRQLYSSKSTNHWKQRCRRVAVGSLMNTCCSTTQQVFMLIEDVGSSV